MSDSGRPAHHLDPLARRVQATPDRTALVDAADGTTWRYDRLDEAVAALAGHLAGLGLVPGDHLGLLVETSVDAVRTIHAAWRLGLRVVPLNVRQSEAELANQTERSDLDALVCDPGLVDTARTVASCPVAVVGGSAVASGGVDALTATDPSTPGSVGWDRDDPALLLFTSGTTGEPKAVALTMGNLLASATASAFRLGVRRTDRWLLCLPVYHMGGLAPVLRSALYGTTLVVQAGFDPDAVARATHDHEVTGLSLVPTQLRRILDAAGSVTDDDPASPLADAVRTVLLGGAPAPAALLDRCGRLGVPVYPTYGLTETASQVATATPEQAFAHEGTVGQPLLDVEVTVVDGDHDPLPAGESGELVVSGPTVTPGYYGDPEATERAFCAHGLLSGDVGYRDEDGRLWVLGRRDDRIVSGAENVDPTVVANALTAAPSVAAAAVVGLPDEEWGERVAALVVPEPDAERDAGTVLDACRERLADFEVPKTLAFADELPRTASGTIDRSRVRKRLSE